MNPTKIIYLSVLLIFSIVAKAQNSHIREITRSELKDKISGYWIGQLTGHYFGFPFELMYFEEPVPVDVDRFYTSRNKGDVKISDNDHKGNLDIMLTYLGGAPSDDDHDLEFVTLHAVEQYGLDITYEEISPMLDQHVKRMVWVSTENAINSIRKGNMPPSTGSKENNPYWRDLMASISTEIWGAFYPGMTQKAADGAEWFGRISNDDYAVYLAKFYAAMYSAAFFESDVKTLIEIGLNQIPEDNILYKGILDVQKWCKEEKEWRKVRKLIYDKYYRKDDKLYLSAGTDALPNGLMGIMSMIYAGDDYKKNLMISTTAGLDCDNQPATIGGLLGVVHGISNLPEDYTTFLTNGKEPYYNMYVNLSRDGLPVRTKISDIVERICTIAETAILYNGGKKSIRDGEIVYTIKTDF